MNSSSYLFHLDFISLMYDPTMRLGKRSYMDANWLTFGAAMHGLVVAAAFVNKKVNSRKSPTQDC